MSNGAIFLLYLEQVVGGSSKMVHFLKHYIKKYTFKSVTTEDFKSTFISFFREIKGLEKIDWNRWLYKTGDVPKKVKPGKHLRVITNKFEILKVMNNTDRTLSVEI